MNVRGLLSMVVCTAALVAAAEAGAWSAPVHRLICERAWQALDGPGRAFVRTVRDGGAAHGRTFAASCAWPDRARDTDHRGTREYHYVNVADGAAAPDRARDCPAHDCVQVAIERYWHYLAAPSDGRNGARRATALAFLGHFVGDLHQPLHVGRASDLGGNRIAVRWPGGRGNLHAFWDGGIARLAGWRGERSAVALQPCAPVPATGDRAAGQAPRAGPSPRAVLQAIDAWASESYQLALTVAYRVPADGALRRGDLARAEEAAHRQVCRAAARLARLIDAARRQAALPGGR